MDIFIMVTIKIKITLKTYFFLDNQLVICKSVITYWNIRVTHLSRLFL